MGLSHNVSKATISRDSMELCGIHNMPRNQKYITESCRTAEFFNSLMRNRLTFFAMGLFYLCADIIILYYSFERLKNGQDLPQLNGFF